VCTGDANWGCHANSNHRRPQFSRIGSRGAF
jgi:hypothetical protein